MSANPPSGATVKLVDCWQSWAADFCSSDLQVTFSVRSNRGSNLADVYTEFVTPGNEVCGEGWAQSRQALSAGVVATFLTTTVYATCAPPFQIVRLRTRIQDHSNAPLNNGVPVEMTKQEFLLDYTFLYAP